MHLLMKKFISGFIIGVVLSSIIIRLKETNKSYYGEKPDENFLCNIGKIMNRSERYKEYRLPYKDLPLVNSSIKAAIKKEKAFK
jgi:hypothetical protein